MALNATDHALREVEELRRRIDEARQELGIAAGGEAANGHAEGRTFRILRRTPGRPRRQHRPARVA